MIQQILKTKQNSELRNKVNFQNRRFSTREILDEESDMVHNARPQSGDHRKNDLENMIRKAKNLAEEEAKSSEIKGKCWRGLRAVVLGKEGLGRNELAERLASEMDVALVAMDEIESEIEKRWKQDEATAEVIEIPPEEEEQNEAEKEMEESQLAEEPEEAGNEDIPVENGESVDPQPSEEKGKDQKEEGEDSGQSKTGNGQESELQSLQNSNEESNISKEQSKISQISQNGVPIFKKEDPNEEFKIDKKHYKLTTLEERIQCRRKAKTGKMEVKFLLKLLGAKVRELHIRNRGYVVSLQIRSDIEARSLLMSEAFILSQSKSTNYQDSQTNNISNISRNHNNLEASQTRCGSSCKELAFDLVIELGMDNEDVMYRLGQMKRVFIGEIEPVEEPEINEQDPIEPNPEAEVPEAPEAPEETEEERAERLQAEQEAKLEQRKKEIERERLTVTISQNQIENLKLLLNLQRHSESEQFAEALESVQNSHPGFQKSFMNLPQVFERLNEDPALAERLGRLTNPSRSQPLLTPESEAQARAEINFYENEFRPSLQTFLQKFAWSRRLCRIEVEGMSRQEIFRNVVLQCGRLRPEVKARPLEAAATVEDLLQSWTVEDNFIETIEAEIEEKRQKDEEERQELERIELEKKEQEKNENENENEQEEEIVEENMQEFAEFTREGRFERVDQVLTRDNMEHFRFAGWNYPESLIDFLISNKKQDDETESDPSPVKQPLRLSAYKKVDPVRFCLEHKIFVGSPEFCVEYFGFAFFFNSPKTKRIFLQNPGFFCKHSKFRDLTNLKSKNSKSQIDQYDNDRSQEKSQCPQTPNSHPSDSKIDQFANTTSEYFQKPQTTPNHSISASGKMNILVRGKNSKRAKFIAEFMAENLDLTLVEPRALLEHRAKIDFSNFNNSEKEKQRNPNNPLVWGPEGIALSKYDADELAKGGRLDIKTALVLTGTRLGLTPVPRPKKLNKKGEFTDKDRAKLLIRERGKKGSRKKNKDDESADINLQDFVPGKGAEARAYRELLATQEQQIEDGVEAGTDSGTNNNNLPKDPEPEGEPDQFLKQTKIKRNQELSKDVETEIKQAYSQKKGFIFLDFPRNPEQLLELRRMGIEIDWVIDLEDEAQGEEEQAEEDEVSEIEQSKRAQVHAFIDFLLMSPLMRDLNRDIFEELNTEICDQQDRVSLLHLVKTLVAQSHIPSNCSDAASAFVCQLLVNPDPFADFRREFAGLTLEHFQSKFSKERLGDRLLCNPLANNQRRSKFSDVSKLSSLSIHGSPIKNQLHLNSFTGDNSHKFKDCQKKNNGNSGKVNFFKRVLGLMEREKIVAQKWQAVMGTDNSNSDEGEDNQLPTEAIFGEGLDPEKIIKIKSKGENLVQQLAKLTRQVDHFSERVGQVPEALAELVEPLARRVSLGAVPFSTKFLATPDELEQQCLDKLIEMNEHVSDIQPLNPVSLSPFASFCPPCLLRHKWPRRCQGNVTATLGTEVFLFCSNSCLHAFTNLPEVYSDFSKSQVENLLLSSARVFVNPGFGNGVEAQFRKKASDWGLGVVDIVQEAAREVKRRVKRVITKLIAVKGFEEPPEDEMDELVVQWLINRESQSEIKDIMTGQPKPESQPGKTPKNTNPVKPPKSNDLNLERDEFGIIMLQSPDAEEENPTEPDEEEDKIFSQGTDLDTLQLELEDMETSREEMEEDVFRAVLDRSAKCMVLLRNQLRGDESASLSREPMAILEKIGRVPDHVALIYVGESTAVQNVFDETRLRRHLGEKKREREEEEKRLLGEAVEREKEERRREKEEEGSEDESEGGGPRTGLPTDDHRNNANQNPRTDSKDALGNLEESNSLKTLAQEMEELGIDREQVLADLPPLPTFRSESSRIRTSIRELTAANFQSMLAFSDALWAAESLVVPIKLLPKLHSLKNLTLIDSIIQRLISLRSRSVAVNGLEMITNSHEQTALQTLKSHLAGKNVKISRLGLTSVFSPDKALTRIDLPVIFQNEVYFLDSIQQMWRVLADPQTLVRPAPRPDSVPLKIFLGGFDSEKTERLGQFIEKEFGLLRLNKERVVWDVLFGKQFEEFISWIPEIENKDEDLENQPDSDPENENTGDQTAPKPEIYTETELAQHKIGIIREQKEKMLKQTNKSAKILTFGIKQHFWGNSTKKFIGDLELSPKQPLFKDVFRNNCNRENSLNHFLTKFESKMLKVLNLDTQNQQNETLTDFKADKHVHLSFSPARSQPPPQTTGNTTSKQPVLSLKQRLHHFVNALGTNQRERNLNSLKLRMRNLLEVKNAQIKIDLPAEDPESEAQSQQITFPEMQNNFHQDFWLSNIRDKVLQGQELSDEDLVYLLLTRLKWSDVKQRGFVLEDIPFNGRQKRLLDSHGIAPHLVFLLDGIDQLKVKQASSQLENLGYIMAVRSWLSSHSQQEDPKPNSLPAEQVRQSEQDLTVVEAKPSQTELANSKEALPTDQAEDQPEVDPEEIEKIETQRKLQLKELQQKSRKDLRKELQNISETFESRRPQSKRLARLISHKLLTRNRLERLYLLSLYQDQFGNVWRLQCDKAQDFNLLFLKKTVKLVKKSFRQVQKFGSHGGAFAIANLALDKNDILKNLNLVRGRLTCLADELFKRPRNFLSFDRKHLLYMANGIWPVDKQSQSQILQSPQLQKRFTEDLDLHAHEGPRLKSENCQLLNLSHINFKTLTERPKSQYLRFDAVDLSQKRNRLGRPDLALIFRKKLYFFASQENMTEFLKFPTIYSQMKLPQKVRDKTRQADIAQPNKDPRSKSSFVQKGISESVLNILNEICVRQLRFPFLSAQESALKLFALQLAAANLEAPDQLRYLLKDKVQQFSAQSFLVKRLMALYRDKENWSPLHADEFREKVQRLEDLKTNTHFYTKRDFFDRFMLKN